MKLALVLITSFFCGFLNAQIGIGTTSPDPSSILEISSADKGFLLPRVPSHSDIVSPAIGLMIFDISDNCLNFYIGNNTWKNPCESSSGSSGVVTNPPTYTEGNLITSMKTCYDIAFSNDFQDGCGALVVRDFLKSDFTQTSSNTQTLNITADVDITELAVVVVDASSSVIETVNQPATTSLLTGESTSTTIEFKQSLNTSAQGLASSASLKSEVYITYKDNNGDDRQRKINLRVQDCNCGTIAQEKGTTGVFMDAEGSIYTYGHNDKGAAGEPSNVIPTTTNSVKSVMTKLTLPTIDGTEAKMAQFNSGHDFTIGVTDQGKVVAWGHSNSGKLGKATNSIEAVPFQIDATRGFPNTETAVGAYGGLNNAVIFTASNKLYAAGQNFYGELGMGHTSQVSSFTEINLNTGLVTSQNGGVAPIPQRVFVSQTQMFFIDEDGDLWGTGNNDVGQLGIGTITNVSYFNKVTSGLPAGNIVNVSPTQTSTLVHMDNGVVYIAGTVTGQILGTIPANQTTGNKISTFNPIEMNGDIAGETGNIVLATFGHSGGPLKVWIYYDNGNLYAKGGTNGTGDLGIVGNPGYVPSFRSVDLSALNGEKISKIKTYNQFAVILSDAGKIYYTGKNNYGFLLEDPYNTNTVTHTFLGAEQPLAKNTIFVN